MKETIKQIASILINILSDEFYGKVVISFKNGKLTALHKEESIEIS